MPYLNSRLCALLAMGLSLVAVPGLRAQEASSTAAPAAIRGDVNGDGRVTRADADAVRTWLVRGTLPDGRGILPAGDANGDGRVTAADAALISRFAAGVDVSRFPVGRPVGAGGERMTGSALVATEYECRVEFRAGPLNCSVVSPTGSNDARLDLMLYKEAAKVVGNGSYSGGNKSNPDTMSYSLAVRNLITQPIGTTDGFTSDTSRLVITSIRLTSPQTTATSQVTNADGTATFVDSLRSAPDTTYTDVPYINYPGLIAPNTNSAADSLYIVFSPSVTAMTFTYRIWTRVQYLHGYVTIAPADSVIGAGQTLSLTASAFTVFGAAGGGVTWSSSNSAVASVDTATGVVTGVSGGTATITATSTQDSRRTATRVIRVIQAVADSYNVTGNVPRADSVLANDVHPVPVAVGFYGWTEAGKTEQGGTVVMNPVGGFTYDPPAGYEGTDSLMYTLVVSGSNAVDTAKVALGVSQMIWFVGTGGESACNPAAPVNQCGRLSDPYPTLADFQNDNNGAGNPKSGHPIFLYEGTHSGSVTLLPQQKLIGQDATGDLATLAGITLAPGSTLPELKPGGAPTIVQGGVVLANVGNGTTANNAVRGLTITPNAAATVALSGTSFGTLTVDDLIVTHPSGQALSLTTGTLSGGLDSLNSGGGTYNVFLSAVNTSGTVILGTAGDSLSGAMSDAFRVTGGNGSFTYPGSIASPAGFAVNVNSKTSGAVTLSGNIQSSAAGTGISVSGNASSAITFSGSINPGAAGPGISVAGNGAGTSVAFTGTTKNITSGVAAGVSLTGNNAGTTIAFTGGGLTISTTTGAGFTASGAGTVTVTGPGNTIASTTGTALSLSSVSTGASVMDFASVSANGAVNGIMLSGLTGAGVKVSGGTIQGTTGPAVSLTNLTGITGQVELTGMALSRTSGTGAVISGSSFGTLALGSTTVSASGGPGAINLTTGSLSGTIPSIGASGVAAGTHAVSLTGVGGTYTVSGGTVNGTSSGDALRVSGGNAVATWNNTLTATSAGGRSVNIASTTGGSYTFANPVTAGNASAGVSITANAGSVTMPGLTLGTSGARFSATPLTLQMGAGNVTLGAVSIFTTGGSATGLGMTSAAGAGTLSVASGIIDAVGSPAVNVAPSSGSQPVSIALTTVNANGGTSGVILNGTSGSFTVTGTGSTANSGGVIQNTSGTAILLTSASNVQMSLMSLQPDATGWLGTNLSGTNGLSRSTVDYLGTAPGGAYAFRVANTNTNATITLDGTTFQNKMDGTTSVSISALGNSVITFNAIDSNTGDAFPSRYRNLFGSGIVVGSGDDVGSTAVVTANISGTTFQDAPSNGLNNLELGVTQNATLIPNVTGNTFDKVALPLATVGVINLNATVMGRVGSNAVPGVISGNTISNIRSGAGPTFAYDPVGTNGYVGMRIAIDNDAGGVNHKLQILNNTVTNVARQGLLVSARGAANNVNVLVQGNTIGTLAAPVGTPSARRGVEIEAQTTATLKVQVANNPSIVGGTSGANSALAIRAGVNAGATSTVHATVTGNTIANPNAGTNDGRFRAETVSGNSGTMCLDLRNNVLESAAKEFQTNNNGGTYGRNASGNTGTITTVGAVGAVASCTLPSF